MFKDFRYRTRKSWSSERRVVGKAEYLAKGENPRFIVTSIAIEEKQARELYEGSAAAEDKMPWQPNLEAAQQLAARTNRLVLIHFWAPWCQPCMRLERDVFSQAETARALEANFVLVKLNSDEAPGTTRMYGVSSLPTDVIIQPNGRLVSQFQSPPTANQYVAQLNQAAAGHRELRAKSSPQISSTPVAGGMAPLARR